MSDVGRLLEQLDDGDLERLAERLAPYLPLKTDGSGEWVDSKAAAAHLGISIHALHRLTAERSIPFSQLAPGGRCYFKRSELDRWRTEE